MRSRSSASIIPNFDGTANLQLRSAPVARELILAVEVLREHVGESVSLKGKVQGYTGVAYSVHAEAGQQLHVSLQTIKGATVFNVYAPGDAPGQEALFRGEVGGSVADLKVTQTGEYRIDVYQMRSSARRGAVTTFALTVALQK
jgi:hypothetical protein